MKKIRIAGATLIGIQFILSVIMVYFTIHLKAIPVKYSIFLAVSLGIMAVIETIMLLRKTTGIAAILISILFSGILIYGIYIVKTTDKALESVTGNKTEFEQVNVYVKNDDPVNSVNDAVKNNYYFGYVENSDNEAVSKTIQEINLAEETHIQTQKYASVVDLANALDNKEIQAIIISTALLDVLDSTEDHTDYSKSLKVIMENEVEMAVEKTPENKKDTIKSDDKHFCVYISGIDTYGSVTIKARSDVNIIAVFNEKTHTVLLVSTPRDYYVYLSNSGSTKDKLTHSGIYGIEVSMETLEMIYDVDLNYYMRLNFTGFERIIDELGGVDVESEFSFSSGDFSYSAGMNHLNGEEALMFARERHAFAIGDRQRGKNQMQVIKAVFDKMMSSQMLSNYGDIMDELSNCFQTNMSKEQVGKIVQNQLDSDKSWKVLTYSVDGYDSENYCYSLGGNAYVMEPYQEDLDYANQLIKTIMEDGSVTQEEIDKHTH